MLNVFHLNVIIRKWTPLIMSGLSRSWTGWTEALNCSFLSSYVAKRCLQKTSVASREERYYRFVRARVVLVEDPLLSGLVQAYLQNVSHSEGHQ